MASPNRPTTTFPPIVRETSTGSTTVTSGGNPLIKKAKGGGKAATATSSSPQKAAPLRMRSDSTGSMKGAFYQGHLPVNQHHHQQHANNNNIHSKKLGAGPRRSSSPQLHQYGNGGGSTQQQLKQQQQQQHNSHPDLAQMAAMAIGSLRVQPRDEQQHPFQTTSESSSQRRVPAPVAWGSAPPESSYSDLLLMLSATTQGSLPDEGEEEEEETASEMESGYGSIQQQQQKQEPSTRGGRWDSLRSHDSTASPLLGTSLASSSNMELSGRTQRRPTLPPAAQPQVPNGAYSWIQRHQDRQKKNQQHQSLPESVFVARPPPPPPPPLIHTLPPPPPPPQSFVAGSDGKGWQHREQHASYYSYTDPRQQEEIALFAAMATPSQPEYISPQGPLQKPNVMAQHSPQYFSSPKKMIPMLLHEDGGHHHQHDDDRSSELQPSTVEEFDDLDDDYMEEHEDHREAEMEYDDGEPKDDSCWGRLGDAWLQWLSDGVKWDEDGTPYFEDGDHWTSLSSWVRFIVYNPVYPEFTSVQQAFWAVFIGIVMGFFTAIWKMFIEACVDFVWKTVPATLLRYGILTDLTGHFPLPYYMILCPAVCGCILSCVTVILPVKLPGQNEWIQDVHSRGVHDAQAFWYIFILSTFGMASGMSLGPEGPLVTVGGMFGSKLGLITKQSILQARVLNLTAASATVGGFFGFPMAGALFVLELPHRMGLQYFEALTPATVATIVAVLTNRMVMKNDVTGYYSYPFMNPTLPSRIFVNAIFYGAFGAIIGVFYAKVVFGLKNRVHDLFHTSDEHEEQEPRDSKEETQLSVELIHGYHQHHHFGEESLPLVGDAHIKVIRKPRPQFCANVMRCIRSICKCTIPHEPTRVAVIGTLAGASVGFIGMFLPHVMFWGEGQLQNLIDKGRTPLPVFVRDDDSISTLAAYGMCMIDPKDPQAVAAGFNMGCSSLLIIAKILCTGLSLGTGMAGGHFWGPLFCGCAASHFLTDLTTWTQQRWGVGGQIAAYPCVSLLCVMGSTHVVTFRAHTAIMLILTLTISAFNPENEVGIGSYKVAGDYSAVFPLLVVAVYTSFILARDTVFYKEQRSRGDIMALPEVLCEPGKVGQPLVVNYDGRIDFQEEDNGDDGDSRSMEPITNWDDEKDEIGHRPEAPLQHQKPPSPPESRSGGQKTTEKDSSDAFEAKDSFSSSQQGTNGSGNGLDWDVSKDSIDQSDSYLKSNSRESGGTRRVHSDVESYFPGSNDDESPDTQARIDELLSRPLDRKPHRNFHRRSQSAPVEQLDAPPARRSRRDLLVRSTSAEKKHQRTGSRDASLDSQSGSQRERSSSSGAGRGLVRVISFGELTNHQPSLLDQARGRSATNAAAESRHHRLPSLPKNSTPSGRHSRWGSDSSSVVSATMASVEASTGALTSDDIERTFSSVVNQHLLQQNG